MLNKDSQLWQYLSSGQRELVQQGFYLLEDFKAHVPAFAVTDYSFLIFPFAKAYEGFLKQLFLDMGFIKTWQYESDHLRIGKILSPGLVRMLRGRSVYGQLVQLDGGKELADRLWQVWKKGRNRVFHYFPHNLAAVTFADAEQTISEIIKVMEEAIGLYNKRQNHHENNQQVYVGES